jgi:hypothetical protein
MMYGFLGTFPDGSAPEEGLHVESGERDSMEKR